MTAPALEEDTTARCGLCKRELRDAVSVAAGYGPVCRRALRPPGPHTTTTLPTPPRPAQAALEAAGQTAIPLQEELPMPDQPATPADHDDPRALKIARHLVTSWDALTDQDQALLQAGAADWLRAATAAGIVTEPTEAEHLRARVAELEQQQEQVARYDIPRPQDPPLWVLLRAPGRWSIHDRNGRVLDRDGRWVFEPDREELCEPTRFGRGEALAFARQLAAGPRYPMYGPYRRVWDASLPPGGFCCSVCGEPVESEPCPEHAPTVGAAKGQR